MLKGYCNKKDGLWDIPIVSTITPNNFVMPPTHSGMYSRQSKPQHSAPGIAIIKSAKSPINCKANVIIK